MKLEYVFSDPECPLINSVCDVINAINIIRKGGQGTFMSSVRYSKRSIISLIVLLLNFLKYRRSVLIPKIVVSAFVGLVYICAMILVVL